MPPKLYWHSRGFYYSKWLLFWRERLLFGSPKVYSRWYWVEVVDDIHSRNKKALRWNWQVVQKWKCIPVSQYYYVKYYEKARLEWHGDVHLLTSVSFIWSPSGICLLTSKTVWLLCLIIIRPAILIFFLPYLWGVNRHFVDIKIMFLFGWFYFCFGVIAMN